MRTRIDIIIKTCLNEEGVQSSIFLRADIVRLEGNKEISRTGIEFKRGAKGHSRALPISNASNYPGYLEWIVAEITKGRTSNLGPTAYQDEAE